MKNILIISTVGLIYDGITSIITSYLEVMDHSDFVVYIAGTIKVEPSICDKLEKMGYKVVVFPNRKSEPVKYFFSICKFIRENKIEVVHAHGNSATLAVDLLAAKLGGCKKRIAHSHNTKCNQVKLDKMLRPLFNHIYTDALACGIDAGKWLFGNKQFTVLKNGRDIEKYRFDMEKRHSLREKLGLNDEDVVVGHVGGFFQQKNHSYLIKIFRSYLEINKHSKLFLIGDGPLKTCIEDSVKDIKSNVVFLGTTDCVQEYLNAFDIMILPSIFEGLPLVVIEWQINGLPCLISDNVTSECKITDSVFFLSLNDSADIWAKEITNVLAEFDRFNSARINYNSIKNSDFNIISSATKLKEIYED